MAFHKSLSDRKSLQVSRTLLSILADLNKAVVWLLCIRPLISKFFIPGTNSLVTVPSTPITIGITVTFLFYSFFSSVAMYRYLSLFSFFFSSFTLWSAGTAKSTLRQVLFFFFFFFLLSLDLVVWPRLDDPSVS